MEELKSPETELQNDSRLTEAFSGNPQKTELFQALESKRESLAEVQEFMSQENIALVQKKLEVAHQALENQETELHKQLEIEADPNIPILGQPFEQKDMPKQKLRID